MRICLARGGEWIRRLALPILWEQRECWTCVCIVVV